MCGRYGRRGDKQKIAEAFHVKGGFYEVDFGEEFDCAPGSIQPVVWMNEEGERTLGLMRWGFKLPKRLLLTPNRPGVIGPQDLETAAGATQVLRGHVEVGRRGATCHRRGNLIWQHAYLGWNPAHAVGADVIPGSIVEARCDVT